MCWSYAGSVVAKMGNMEVFHVRKTRADIKTQTVHSDFYVFAPKPELNHSVTISVFRTSPKRTISRSNGMSLNDTFTMLKFNVSKLGAED